MNSINANSFPWIPKATVFFDMERWYINMNWINRQNGFWFDPIYQAVDLDPVLREKKALDKQVLLTINQTPEWRLTRDGVPNLGDGHWTETKLGKWNKDGTNPLNWIESAQDFFKITARYGRKSWPVDLLGVDEAVRWEARNQPLTAQDLVNFIEPGNEDRAWWRPEATSLNSQEFAAYMSMVYDGHEGRVPHAGIKVADPTMQVVLPGLPNLDLTCLQEMNEWFKANRTDKKFAADIINVHHYSNAGNSSTNLQSQWTHACSPEDDKVRLKLKGIVDFANSLSIPLPVWWSEFGANTLNVNTTQGIIPFAGKSTEQIQSEWLKRSYLEAIMAGVKNMFMFETADEHRRSEGGMWITCGLVLAQNNPQGKMDQDSYKPKLSWYGLKDLNTWIKGFNFMGDGGNSDGVRFPLFKQGNIKHYIYYLPTSSGQTKAFTLEGRNLVATEDPQLLEVIDGSNPPDPPFPPINPPNPPVKPPLTRDTFEITLKNQRTQQSAKTIVQFL